MLTGDDFPALGFSAKRSAWIVEKFVKDSTSSFEFHFDKTEAEVKDYADSILGSTPEVDSVSIYRKVGTIKRVTTTSWE